MTFRVEGNLSDMIVQYRAKHCINQTEFARRCNLTKQTICSIEGGRTNITKVTRAKILRLLESENESED